MTGDVLPVRLPPTAAGGIQAEEADEPDSLHRRLLGQIGQLREGQRGAGDVLSQGDACGVILSRDADPLIDGEARVFPAQEGCGKILIDEAFGQEELDEGAAEGNA